MIFARLPATALPPAAALCGPSARYSSPHGLYALRAKRAGGIFSMLLTLPFGHPHRQSPAATSPLPDADSRFCQNLSADNSLISFASADSCSVTDWTNSAMLAANCCRLFL